MLCTKRGCHERLGWFTGNIQEIYVSFEPNDCHIRDTVAVRGPDCIAVKGILKDVMGYFFDT